MKEQAVQLINEEFERIKQTPHLEDHRTSGLCLIWALATTRVLNRMGQRSILQAGSLSWPIIKPEQDDGVCATHFSYKWSPHEAPSMIAMSQNRMPEMHCWAALPDTNEIVDLTVKFLPEQAKLTSNLIWTAEPPPPYLWSKIEDLPDGVYYIAEIPAIRLAHIFLMQLGLRR